jgi:hypothetical protein
MNLDSRSFQKNICMPESKSIRGRGGCHKLLLFLSVIPKQQNRTNISIV